MRRSLNFFTTYLCISLDIRRRKISLTFAKKNVNHPKMKHLFPSKKSKATRSGYIFTERQFPTTRCQKGPINYLTQLLNENNINQNKKIWNQPSIITEHVTSSPIVISTTYCYFYHCFIHPFVTRGLWSCCRMLLALGCCISCG